MLQSFVSGRFECFGLYNGNYIHLQVLLSIQRFETKCATTAAVSESIVYSSGQTTTSKPVVRAVSAVIGPITPALSPREEPPMSSQKFVTVLELVKVTRSSAFAVIRSRILSTRASARFPILYAGGATTPPAPAFGMNS